MCIISVSEIGVDIPTREIIEEMWVSNRDGAGFMYAANGKVYIRKGFMVLEDFLTAIEQLKSEIDVVNTSIVMHFRIGTHGGNTPANTHPFPVTDKIPLLQKESVICDTGVAHNGIIRCVTPRTNISDTMEFIASVLNPLRRLDKNYYKNEDIQNLINTLLDGDRMVILNGRGEVTYFGNWIEDGGIYYSNRSYIPYTKQFNWDFEPDSLTVPNIPKGVIKTKWLAWLDDEDTLLVSPDNDMYETGFSEILYDTQGNVYCYDYDNDIAIHLNGWSLKTANFNPYLISINPTDYDRFDVVEEKDFNTYFYDGTNDINLNFVGQV